MENWRRFQATEDDRLIVEGKRKSFESLMERVTRGDLDPLVVAIALDEHVSQKLPQFDSILTEGFIKDSIKKAGRALLSFIVKKIGNIQSLLSSGVSKKVLDRCKKILSNLTPYLKKISIFMGPVARAAFLVGISMLFCSEAAASTVQSIPVDFDLLGEMMKLWLDMSPSGEGYDLVTTTAQELSNVAGDAGNYATDAQELSNVAAEKLGKNSLGPAYDGVQKVGIEVAEMINMLAEEAKRNDGIVPEGAFEKALDAMSNEGAIQFGDLKAETEELCKVDPDVCKDSGQVLEQLETMYRSSIESVVKQFKAGDGTVTKVNQDLVTTAKSIKR
jgi:hypothetical protein